MYAVVDIETTGNFTGRHKITEIAIYIFDGKEIVDEYQTLVNPESSIPPYISSMTGITNTVLFSTVAAIGSTTRILPVAMKVT